MKTKKYSIEKRQARWGFAFTIPCLVFFAVFAFYPIISAFITSLTNRKAISRNYSFVGLENYIYIFTKGNGGYSLLNSLRATLVFTVGTFIPMVVISLLVAVLLSQLRKPGHSKFYELCFYTPAVLSSVVAATIWMILFQPTGLVNQFSNYLMRTSGRDYQWLTRNNMLQVEIYRIFYHSLYYWTCFHSFNAL